MQIKASSSSNEKESKKSERESPPAKKNRSPPAKKWFGMFGKFLGAPAQLHLKYIFEVNHDLIKLLMKGRRDILMI